MKYKVRDQPIICKKLGEKPTFVRWVDEIKKVNK